MGAMTLSQMRQEVLNHGFDGGVYSGRINQWINDAYEQACRVALFSTDMATQDTSTTAGTSVYSLPADMVTLMSVRNTNLDQELSAVDIRDIDRSSHTTTGAPFAYAINAANLQLYPVPDGAYPIEVRYWKLPADLVADGDTPAIPADYHRMLWYWATAEAYWSEDDGATGAQWENRFNTLLAKFESDVKFPDENAPSRIRGMWQSGRALNPRGWTRYGQDWGV